MLFKNLVLSALAASAVAKPINRCKPNSTTKAAAVTTAAYPVPDAPTKTEAVETKTGKAGEEPTTTTKEGSKPPKTTATDAAEADESTTTKEAGKPPKTTKTAEADEPTTTVEADEETTTAEADETTTAEADETTTTEAIIVTTTKDTNEAVTTTEAPAQPTVEPGEPAPVGELLTHCVDPNHIALTFDDGPYTWTADALDLLDAADMKATFFFNGANWASIYNHEAEVKRIVDGGHQFGSHTWSHMDLGAAKTTNTDVKNQMVQLEEATLSIVGLRPTWVRLPYLSVKAASKAVLKELGYKIADVSIDTKDYELQNDPQQAVANFKAGLEAGGSIVLAHEVHERTVDTILPGIIKAIQDKQKTNKLLKAVTIGTCLGERKSDWYETTARA